MPDTDTSREPESVQAPVERPRSFITWRSILVTVILLVIVMMAVVPPLLNVNRFKRRIVTSISTSLGRPVHLDNVSLVLLPLPGFKLENFVVAEDPAFGSEPVIHANIVLATLRVSSLWRRRVEFSKISLQEPSINLVHDAGGRWNVEAILLQAARIQAVRIPAAPTTQAKASADPRFPYVEATGARVNIKSGVEKLPFSLTDADFALWLPNPQQWRVRLVAKPTRTDTNSSDTGTISLEGSLGHADRFDGIPLELAGEWQNVPLGEASRVLTGRDAGLRGDLRLNLSASGTIGSSLIRSNLFVQNARRDAFVPERSLDLHAECLATSSDTFHAFHQIRCTWPPASSTSSSPTVLALTGDLPDIHHPASASLQIGSPGIPAATLLDWLRIASPRIPADVTASGTLSGTVSALPASSTAGRLDLKRAALTGGPLGTVPLKLGPISIVSAATPIPEAHPGRRIRPVLPPLAGTCILAPATIPLGARDPAILDGRFDRDGYTLHLTGNVLASRLLALADALPQFGDGLRAVIPLPDHLLDNKDASAEAPIHIDLTSNRIWLSGQTWSKTVRKPAAKLLHHRR